MNQSIVVFSPKEEEVNIRSMADQLLVYKNSMMRLRENHNYPYALSSKLESAIYSMDHIISQLDAVSVSCNRLV